MKGGPSLPAQRPSLWIDCDTGIDDALALCFAVGSGAPLLGVSTVAGNCALDAASANTLRVLELAGARRTPVHAGAGAPLCGRPPDARAIHGDDGLGGRSDLLPQARSRLRTEPAAAALAAALRARPGQVTIIATGPLTNLALLLALDAGAAAASRHLVVMGGAAQSPGNVGPTVEFNIGFDPEAAAAVLAGPWPITVVGLDVTGRVRMGEAEASALDAARGPVGAFCAAVLRAYAEAYRLQGDRAGAAMHDPLAVAIGLDGSLVSALQVPVDIELRGALTRGMLVADRRVLERPPLLAGRRTVQVCIDVDAERARTRLLAGWGATATARTQE